MPDRKDTVAGRADPAGDPPAMTRARVPQPRAEGFRSACYISDQNAQRCNNAKGISAPNKRAALIVPRDVTRDDAGARSVPRNSLGIRKERGARLAPPRTEVSRDARASLRIDILAHPVQTR